jgi:hypothetical protein
MVLSGHDDEGGVVSRQRVHKYDVSRISACTGLSVQKVRMDIRDGFLFIDNFVDVCRYVSSYRDAYDRRSRNGKG